jgi:membrane associated rhomboid family serine protease
MALPEHPASGDPLASSVLPKPCQDGCRFGHGMDELRQHSLDPSGLSRLDRLKGKALLPVAILSIAWIQECVDQLLFGGRWNLPLVQGGPFWGLLTAPFSHAGFAHLLANSLWFLPLSWLVLLHGRRAYLAVWLGVLVAAIPVWWFWPVGSHGLSGVVYGLLGYLLVIGWLEKRPLSLLLSGVVLVAYGGVLPSLLPIFSAPGVSWIGHVSGFAGGLLAAAAVQRRRA